MLSRFVSAATAARILVGLACLVPYAILVGYVYRYGVNVPFADQWELVVMIRKSRTTGLTAADFLAQHGEQRMFFPRIIMMALATLTHWNIRMEMLAILVLAAGIFSALMFLVVRTFSPLHWWTALPAVAVSLFTFSPVQWENWLWGWQISWFLPPLSFLVAASVLWAWPEDKPAWLALAVAALATVVGQLSLLSGTITWVACLPILLTRRKFRKLTWLWVAAGALCTMAYMYRYVSPPSMAGIHATPAQLLADPKRPVAYLLYLLGRPVLESHATYILGALFLAVFASVLTYLLVFRRDRWGEASIWLAVSSYAFISAASTTVGRLNLRAAGSSRYTTLGILFIVGTLGLLSVSLLPRPREEGLPLKTASIVVAWSLVATMFLLSYSPEVVKLKMWHAQRVADQKCFQDATGPQDPCLVGVYPVPEIAYDRAQYLRSIGWAGFHN